MAPDSFNHLRFTRLGQVNSKRKKGGFGGVVKPEDPQGHAQKLLDQLTESANKQRGIAGFDPRLLVKLMVEGISPDDLEAIPGIQLVCQEEKAIVVVFVDDAAKGEFHRRLLQMSATMVAHVEADGEDRLEVVVLDGATYLPRPLSSNDQVRLDSCP